MRPRMKDYARRLEEQELVLVPDAGVEITLADPTGQVRALIALLDGTRTVEDASSALAAQWPELTPGDVLEGIRALDDAGLLEDSTAETKLSAAQRDRYFTNLAFFAQFATLDRSRYEFQEGLLDSHVVLLGVGGLGSTVLLHLVGLAVGRITIVDSDQVELRNLTRQFLYTEDDVGRSKCACALERARSLNSEIEITAIEQRIGDADDVARLLPGVQLLVCAIDEPPDVEYWVNRACIEAGVPFVSGGYFGMKRGLYYSVDPGRSGCFECARVAGEHARTDMSSWLSPREAVNRSIGPVANLVGSFIALEAFRYLTRFAEPVSAGTAWMVDFATGEVQESFTWPKLEDCSVCGRRPEASRQT
jgi:molybdopterin/thiamine biosynthesis adenylyltransferase